MNRVDSPRKEPCKEIERRLFGIDSPDLVRMDTLEKEAWYISGRKEQKPYVHRYTGEEKNGREIIFLHGKMEYGDRHDALCTLLADTR